MPYVIRVGKGKPAVYVTDYKQSPGRWCCVTHPNAEPHSFATAEDANEALGNMFNSGWTTARTVRAPRGDAR